MRKRLAPAWASIWLCVCVFAGAAWGQTFTGAMSGSWWDPARSSEGQLVSFETIGMRAFLSYFTSVLTTFSRIPMQAFIESLTDPCLRDRDCCGAWIPRPDEAPDGHQLNARDASGNFL